MQGLGGTDEEVVFVEDLQHVVFELSSEGVAALDQADSDFTCAVDVHAGLLLVLNY